MKNHLGRRVQFILHDQNKPITTLQHQDFVTSRPPVKPAAAYVSFGHVHASCTELSSLYWTDTFECLNIYFVITMGTLPLHFFSIKMMRCNVSVKSSNQFWAFSKSLIQINSKLHSNSYDFLY